MSLTPGTMAMTRGVAAIAVVAFLLPADALAQATTRRVFVDATTAAGASVVDLRADEFEITEGGERREVASSKMAHRPSRIVLIVDSTDAIRQPIGLVRKALTELLERIDPQHEMMLVSVAGTPRVRPTLERQQLVKSAENIFGTTGSNTMHRVIDDLFHRFAQTTDFRPIFVVVTTEGFESTQNINPQEIAHLTDHFAARGGRLHAIRLLVPTAAQTFRGGNLTDLPVSLMIAQASPAGLTRMSQRTGCSRCWSGWPPSSTRRTRRH